MLLKYHINIKIEAREYDAEALYGDLRDMLRRYFDVISVQEFDMRTVEEENKNEY
ncbi:MAG: hypothetical protein WC755_01965 [Candidatus Woesearchaeota archaeon]|jgi:hypothetical protein